MLSTAKRSFVAMLLFSGLLHLIVLYLGSTIELFRQTPKEKKLTIRLVKWKPKKQVVRKKPKPQKRLKKAIVTPPRPRRTRKLRKRAIKRPRVVRKRRRSPPKRRIVKRQKTPIKKPHKTPSLAKKNKQTQKKPKQYRFLDLRPSRLPGLTKAEKERNKRRAWAGTDHFSRTMQKYHAGWKEMMKDRAGLTDMFIGKATVTLDRCLEVWFKRRFVKHLKARNYGLQKIGNQAVVGAFWQGTFHFSWDGQGKPKVELRDASGAISATNVVLAKANYCMKRVQPPKRLKGKRINIQLKTRSVVRINLSVPLGMVEERVPETGGTRWTWTRWSWRGASKRPTFGWPT